jgi:hypothetical protein
MSVFYLVFNGKGDKLPDAKEIMTLGTLRALIRDLPDDTPIVVFNQNTIDGDMYRKASVCLTRMRFGPAWHHWFADRHGAKVIQVY